MELPPKEVEIVRMNFSPVEKDFYEALKQRSKVRIDLSVGRFVCPMPRLSSGWYIGRSLRLSIRYCEKKVDPLCGTLDFCAHLANSRFL